MTTQLPTTDDKSKCSPGVVLPVKVSHTPENWSHKELAD